MYVAKNAFQH